MQPASNAERPNAQTIDAGTVLALDTSGPCCAAALARMDGQEFRILASRTEPMERGHAERLVPLVGELLGEAGFAWSDLGRVGVTTGPGSFTGVRVGIAAARGLALALGIPAIGIGTLDALVEMPDPKTAAGSAAGTIVACLDARRGEIYLLARAAGSGADLVPASALAPAAAARSLLAEGIPPYRLVGSGSALLAEALAREAPGCAVSIVSDVRTPDIAAVARLAAIAAPGTPPAPLYLRGPDAKPQSGGVALAERSA
jgi:tRNA threonylcarbamoyladenosine biosynthesis protein TsaB